MLWTVRATGQMGCGDPAGINYLEAAVTYLRDHGINIPDEWVNKNATQEGWSASPKAYAHVYVDDAALGCPLIHPSSGERPYVDWETVGPALMNMAQRKLGV